MKEVSTQMLLCGTRKILKGVPSGFKMKAISPETDFSYDFQDLDFLQGKIIIEKKVAETFFVCQGDLLFSITTKNCYCSNFCIRSSMSLMAATEIGVPGPNIAATPSL